MRNISTSSSSREIKWWRLPPLLRHALLKNAQISNKLIIDFLPKNIVAWQTETSSLPAWRRRWYCSPSPPYIMQSWATSDKNNWIAWWCDGNPESCRQGLWAGNKQTPSPDQPEVQGVVSSESRDRVCLPFALHLEHVRFNVLFLRSCWYLWLQICRSHEAQAIMITTVLFIPRMCQSRIASRCWDYPLYMFSLTGGAVFDKSL